MGRQIDFIVTHYNEPWKIGEPFFQMLAMQRNVDFSQIRVIVVQNGEEGNLNWDRLTAKFPYQVDVISIEKSSVSAARNVGIENADADWVMFCDFDDMFTDICSLNMILDLIPTDRADILWMGVYQEQFFKMKYVSIYCQNEYYPYAYGKLFRLSFLKEKGIYFPEIPYEYDYVFCNLCVAICGIERVMQIKTKFIMYVKTVRKGSYTTSLKNNVDLIESVFYGDKLLADEYKWRELKHKRAEAVARTVIDAYYILNTKPEVTHHQQIENSFREFYKRNKDLYKSMPVDELMVLEEEKDVYIGRILSTLFNNFVIEADQPKGGIYNVQKWLDYLDNPEVEEQPEETEDDLQEEITVHHGGEHPFLTVIMPAHNAASYITNGLESIRRQSFQDYELIVICDACIDNTAEIARKYTDRVFEVNNHLPGPTRNTGIDNAKGEWIIFIDDDDWFLHEFVFEMLKDRLGKEQEDVLHFAWLWKGKGYFANKPDELMTQVCGHVWKREFIGNTRFGDKMFAEDAEFLNDMMDKDPVSVCWNMPLYYYNFGRTGSICWWHQRGRR